MKNQIKVIVLCALVIASGFAVHLRLREAKAFTSFGTALIPAVPVSVVADVPFSVKEQIEDVLVRKLAQKAQSKLQDGVLSKIQTAGRLGGPAFIGNWQSFLQDAQYIGEGTFQSMLSDAISKNEVCDYLKGPLSLIFKPPSRPAAGISSGLNRIYDLQPYGSKVRCSNLVKSLDLNTFREDFTQGGWGAWDELIKPQNNFLGTYNTSLTELIKRRSFSETADAKEGTSGSGFTSKRDCTGQTTLTCIVLGQIQTPGKILEDTVQRSIDEDFSWITSADEFSELLLAIGDSLFNAVISKIDNLGGGGGGFSGGGGGGGGQPANGSGEEPAALDASCLSECMKNTDSVCSEATPACIDIAGPNGTPDGTIDFIDRIVAGLGGNTQNLDIATILNLDPTSFSSACRLPGDPDSPELLQCRSNVASECTNICTPK